MKTIFQCRYCLLIHFIFLYSSGFAQGNLYQLNQEDYDDQKIHFGINVGFVRSHYNILHSPEFLKFDSINVVESINSSGINFAGLVDIRLSNNFSFRTYPVNLIFTEKTLIYNLSKPNIALGEYSSTIKKVSGVSLALPVELKFNSDRINNFRVYMLTGMRVEYDLASNTGKKNNFDLVTLKKVDYTIEAAIGFHFYLPMVVLTPEIKLSYGLRNLLSNETSLKYSKIISSVQSRSLLFTLTFE
jgi:Outer membrane protein beta-barrel domain